MSLTSTFFPDARTRQARRRLTLGCVLLWPGQGVRCGSAAPLGMDGAASACAAELRSSCRAGAAAAVQPGRQQGAMPALPGQPLRQFPREVSSSRCANTYGTAYPTGTSRSCSPSSVSPLITSPFTGGSSGVSKTSLFSMSSQWVSTRQQHTLGPTRVLANAVNQYGLPEGQPVVDGVLGDHRSLVTANSRLREVPTAVNVPCGSLHV